MSVIDKLKEDCNLVVGEKPYVENLEQGSEQVRQGGRGGMLDGSVMIYKLNVVLTIMRLAGSATSATSKPQKLRRAPNGGA